MWCMKTRPYNTFKGSIFSSPNCNIDRPGRHCMCRLGGDHICVLHDLNIDLWLFLEGLSTKLPSLGNVEPRNHSRGRNKNWQSWWEFRNTNCTPTWRWWRSVLENTVQLTMYKIISKNSHRSPYYGPSTFSDFSLSSKLPNRLIWYLE